MEELEQRLEHRLLDYLPLLARFRHRRQLEQSPLYARLRPEVDRVIAGLEWRRQPPRPATGERKFVRAVAWNIERGKRFEGICAQLDTDPTLRDADLLLLTEVDIGMDRSGRRNVAREIADRLGMAYLYANGYLLLSPGDRGERHNAWPVGLSLHGNALLSRYPIGRCDTVGLPEFRDKFHALEKRLGQKRAIIAEVLLPDGPLAVVVVHTDPFAGPRHRARQMRRVLASVERFGHRRVLLGGDLNTNTWNLGGPVGLSIDIGHKVLRLGLTKTIEQYVTPGEIFERETFRALREHELLTEEWNEPSVGTTYFDMGDEALMKKSLDHVPRFALRWLRRRLQPWNGVVPLRIDWFAARGLTPAPGHLPDTDLAATSLSRPTWQGELCSDHDPIVADIKLG